MTEERSWYLDQRQSTSERGSSETGQVPDDSATDSHDYRASVGKVGQHLVP